MKKTLWMLGVAVAALTSCTESEVVDVPESRVIGFDQFVGNNTRAEVNNTTLKNIWVFGYSKAANAVGGYSEEEFENVHIYYAEADNERAAAGWVYDELKYWKRNTNYRFAAYANGVEETSSLQFENENEDNYVKYNPDDDSDPDVDDGDQINFINYTTDGSHDLVASISGDKNVGDDLPAYQVSFNFNHLLSKIVIRLASVTSATFKVKKIEILNAYNKGDCKYDFLDEARVPDREWDLTGNTLQSVAYTLLDNANAPTVLTSTMTDVAVGYVIPQENANIKLRITIETFDSDDESVHERVFEGSMTTKISDEVTYTENKWQPAFVYTYIYQFGVTHDEKPIEFNVNNIGGFTAAGQNAIELNMEENLD